VDPRVIATFFPAKLGIDDERGASLVEYAFLVGLIAMVALAAVAFLGSSTSTKYSNITSQVSNAGN